MLAIPMKIAGRCVVVTGACAMVVTQATVVFAASSTPVPAPAVYNCTCTLVRDMDPAGPNVFEPGRRGVVSPGACCALCQSYGNCSGFTWMNDAPPYDNYCSLKTARKSTRRVHVPRDNPSVGFVLPLADLSL